MKQTRRSKLLVALLASIMVMIAMVPVTVFAEDGGSEPIETMSIASNRMELSDNSSWEECTACSPENPHTIATVADLDKIRTHIHTDGNITSITGYFKLANDIVFLDEDFEESGAFYNGGYGWLSIGKESGTTTTVNEYFSGVFDGDNHSISNLKTMNQTAYVGLFSKVGSQADRTAIVKNLTMQNAILNEHHNKEVQCGRPMGTIAGDNYATISNVTVDGCKLYSVKGNVGAVAAGLVGGTIENCVVLNTEVYGIATSAGGNNNGDKSGLICGYAQDDAQIIGCTVQESKVEADSRGSAGIVGIQYGSTVKNCTVQNCEIVGKDECVGGISGGNYAGDWSSSIENCTVMDCAITGATSVGGIEGNVGGGIITISLKNNIVSDCILTLNGKNLNFAANAGGILAGVKDSNVTATIENCLAHQIQIDSNQCSLSEESRWPIRLGSICASGSESLEISNVFADVKIIHANSGKEQVGGICTGILNVDVTTPIILKTAPINTFYMQYDGMPMEDHPYSKTTRYAFSPDLSEKTVVYPAQITLTEIFGVNNLPNGNMVKYTSSNENVLLIADDKVIVQGGGTTTINCSVVINQMEKIFASVPVTVTNVDQSISYATTAVEKHINDDAFINELTKTTVSGEITYTSSEPSVAAVNETTGEVIIKGAGTAIITATAAKSDTHKEAVATYTLTVTDHSFTNYVSNKDATCTDDGTKTASCTYGCGETDTVTDTGSAKGHDWGETTYAWSEDGKSCTASKVCLNDNTHTEMVQAIITSEQTKAPSYTEKGETTYTAIFDADWASRQTKTIADVPATGVPEGPGDGDSDETSSNMSEPRKPYADSPQTGDNSNMILWIVLLFGAVGAVLVLKRKR